MQKTFSIIKPDAVKRNLIGHINQMIENADLKILASKKIYLTKNLYNHGQIKAFLKRYILKKKMGKIVLLNLLKSVGLSW